MQKSPTAIIISRKLPKVLIYLTLSLQKIPLDDTDLQSPIGQAIPSLVKV